MISYKNLTIYKLIFLLLCLFALASLSGCTKEDKKAERPELVLCSSMGKEFTEKMANAYVQKTGAKIRINYLPAGTQTERLDYLRANKIDVWLGGTAEEYYVAEQQRILEAYTPKEAYKVPAQLRQRSGQWTSLYLSYIALLSNKYNLHSYGLYAPETWDELLAPELDNEIAMPEFTWGGVSFGMLTSIWQMRGKERALEYAAKLNAQHPQYTNGFGEAVDLVYIGKKTVAVVPLDYALLMENRHSHLFATVIKDANRAMLTGAAILQGAPHEQTAQNFLDFLMSDEGEQVLQNSGFHYMWHVKNYAYNDDRRQLVGNVQVPVDDLSWTAGYKSEIIRQWNEARVSE